jgi:S1-C subfamily serine protease
MGSVRKALAAVALLSSGTLVGADEPSRNKELLALQEAVQKVIERAEPSVACVLVSRSDAYKKLEKHVGVPPSDPAAGKLGRFDSQALLGAGNLQDLERRKYILSLDLSNLENVPESFGSGVVIDEAGLVLTNAHVVRNATKVFVRLPGSAGSWADIHAADPRSDLAVLRLLDPPPGLKAIKPGDGDAVKKGQFVVSLANPFGAGFRDGSPSASWGIVSNLRRRAPGNADETERARQQVHFHGTLIQTDTRITLGCSGGALLNLQGELIGLTTSVAALSGSETPGGFAVPMDTGLRRIVEKLRQGEEVEYGFLGVQLLQAGDAGGKGVVLADVSEGSPAQRAGLQKGDRVVAIDGQPVRDQEDLFRIIGTRLAGNTVRVEAVRAGGSRLARDVHLAKFYVPGKFIASRRPPARGGLRVDYTSLIGQRGDVPFRWRGIPEGVLIREVVPGSPADKAQLQENRVITKVNNHKVTTPAEFYDKMARAEGPTKLTLLGPNGLDEDVTIDVK